MNIAHPPHVEATHVPVSHYHVGPYWFLKAMPKCVLVSEVETFEWWASYCGDWVRRESFQSLEEAMIAAANFAKEKRHTRV